MLVPEQTTFIDDNDYDSDDEHRRSQDFHWGIHFSSPKKLTTFFLF